MINECERQETNKNKTAAPVFSNPVWRASEEVKVGRIVMPRIGTALYAKNAAAVSSR